MDPRLPLALIAHVIHHIDSLKDRDLLRAVALVSKSWLPFARYGLFHTVYIKKTAQLHFLRGLFTSDPCLASVVRQIYCITSTSGPPDAHHSSQDESLHNIAPPILLPHLLFVRSWKFTADSPDPQCQPFRNTTLLCFTRYSRIRHLHLENMVFETLADCARLLLSMITIRRLCLGPNVTVRCPSKPLTGVLFNRLRSHLYIWDVHVRIVLSRGGSYSYALNT